MTKLLGKTAPGIHKLFASRKDYDVFGAACTDKCVCQLGDLLYELEANSGLCG